MNTNTHTVHFIELLVAKVFSCLLLNLSIDAKTSSKTFRKHETKLEKGNQINNCIALQSTPIDR